jgi:putative membrane protein
MLFGGLVWIVSYLGWLPMTGFLSSALRHPAERNELMITAHLIWGAVIASITDMTATTLPKPAGLRHGSGDL